MEVVGAPTPRSQKSLYDFTVHTVIRVSKSKFTDSANPGSCSIVKKWKVKVKSLSRVRLFATPWTNVAHQVPPSLGFSRQEVPIYYWKSSHTSESLPFKPALLRGQLVTWVLVTVHLDQESQTSLVDM